MVASTKVDRLRDAVLKAVLAWRPGYWICSNEQIALERKVLSAVDKWTRATNEAKRRPK